MTQSDCKTITQSDGILMSEETQIFSSKFRWILIIVGALLTGLAWRIRGDGNFGSFWGMLVPATLLSLFIFYVFPKDHRFKLTSAVIGVTIILMALTVGGWGTIVGQITGRLYTNARPGVAGYDIEVNPIHGLIALFLIGFGWVPIWAFLIGRFFSKETYGFKDLIIIIALFYITKYVSELLFAHFIVPIIAPDAYQLFVDSLGGISPWEAYVTHFNDDAYLESIAGGRNYGSMISNTSSSLGSLVIWVYLRFKLKDKTAAKIMIQICVIFGLAITVADLWQLWGREEFHWYGTIFTWIAPDSIAGNSWALWEYTTGFLAGGSVIWLLLRHQELLLAENNDSSEMRTADQLIPLKLEKVVKVGVTWFFVCGAAILRALGSSLDEQFADSGIYAYAIGVLLLLILAVLFGKGKLKMPNWTIQKYSFIGTICFTSIYVAIYVTSGYFDITGIANLFVIISFIVGMMLLVSFNAKFKYLGKERV
jgi:hypothetical protein